jgi:hypothetical protein
MAMLRSFIGKFTIPLLCLLFLAGCTQKIDGSSKEAYDASVEKITKSMPEEEGRRFRKALNHIAIKSLKLGELFRKHPNGVGLDKQALVPGQALREMVDGKTVPEVLEMGAAAQAEQEARRAAAMQMRAGQGKPPLGPMLSPSGPGQAPAAAGPAAPLGPVLPPSAAGAAPAAATPTPPPAPQS